MADRIVPENQVNGYVVVVLSPTGCPDAPAADAYGPHDEAAAHDIATLAARAGHPAFLLNLGTVVAERYTGDPT